VSSWYERAVTLANNKSFSASETVEAGVSGYRSPTVLVSPDTISGTDDTLTIEAVGAASTYQIDSTTVSSVDGTDDYTVDIPQCETVKLTSANGETHSAEVRENHG